MCTTRMMTGVGRPQFSAVLECAAEARRLGRHVWADGGVRHPRDVALALAAGRVQRDDRLLVRRHLRVARATLAADADGRLYKENFGMASARAVTTAHGRGLPVRPGPQGAVRGGHLDLADVPRPGRPSVEDLIDAIVAGLRSRPAPTRAPRTLEEFHERAVVGVQSASGYAEGMPLHQSW